MTLLLHHRVRLNRSARLRFDAFTQSHILLSPERGLRLNQSARDVLEHCTGNLTVQDVIERVFNDLAVQSACPNIEQISSDVLDLLNALYARHLVTIEQPQ